MPAPVIYINGFPGVGKLTTANMLQKLIGNSLVIDNHSLIDPVEKVCPRGTMRYQEKRGEHRRSVLEPIKNNPALHSTVYIFTDSQTEHNECMGDYTDLACGSDARRFFSVILECDWAENARRLTMAGRGGKLNGKLTDVDVLRGYRETGGGIWKFGDDDELVIDVTESSAEEGAAQIFNWYQDQLSRPRVWEDF